MPDLLGCRPNANNTFVRRPYKLSAVHRLRLTHGEQPPVPKLIRESTDQFLAKATAHATTNSNSFETSNKSRKSLVRSLFSRESLRRPHPERNRPSARGANHQEEHRPLTAQSKSTSRKPIIVLPPIEHVNSDKTVTSPTEATPTEELILPPLESMSTPSLYLPSSSVETPDDEDLLDTAPVTEDNATKTAANASTKLIERPKRRKERDRFLIAYERALAIAQARRSIYDPYRLLGPKPTRNVLYSYYDHTPACVFTHGSACGHYGQKPIDYDRRSFSELARRRIYDDIVVDSRPW